MLAYKVILTWESIYDAAEIAEYIEDRFSEYDADKFQKNIREEFKKIASNAKLYTKTHILYRGYNIYKKVFSPSLIFYTIKEDEGKYIFSAFCEMNEIGKIS